MKRIFIMLAFVAISLLTMAQTNQLVWCNGRLICASPIEMIDSLTYSEMEGVDTLHLLLPRVDVRVERDTLYIYDTVYIEVPSTGGSGETYEAVDLGLSVKWATCNIGATNPEEYGNYYAWGEVETKEEYSWSSYTYCVDTFNKHTKYCSLSSYGNEGFTDNRVVLDSTDDAAMVNWGETWRMPSNEEFIELKEKCTWVWTSQNGVSGYKITGANGNSIFLPAGGYSINDETHRAGTHGYYWANSLDVDGPSRAYGFFFYSNSVDYFDWNTSSRCEGHLIRPVCQ